LGPHIKDGHFTAMGGQGGQEGWSLNAGEAWKKERGSGDEGAGITEGNQAIGFAVTQQLNTDREAGVAFASHCFEGRLVHCHHLFGDHKRNTSRQLGRLVLLQSNEYQLLIG
jgi:hypothetical protein